MKVLCICVFLLFLCHNLSKRWIQFDSPPFSNLTQTSRIVNLPNGYYYKFIYLTDTKYKIEWGNKLFKNISEKTFEVLGNGILNFVDSNSGFIIFKQGCGQRCNYAVILPLLEKQKEKTYEDVVKINTKNQVIACMSYDPESFLVLKNYSNEKEIIIKEDDMCPAVNPIECIDSCFFRGSYFIIYWQGSKWNIESPDNKMQKIKIPY